MTGESNSSAQPNSVQPSLITRDDNISHTQRTSTAHTNVTTSSATATSSSAAVATAPSTSGVPCTMPGEVYGFHAPPLGGQEELADVHTTELRRLANADAVPADEVDEPADVLTTLRSTRARLDSAQTKANSSNAGQKQQKQLADAQRQQQTSSYYAKQINARCEDLWEAIDNPPEITVGRSSDMSEEDICFNNSMAQGLLRSHIERIKKWETDIDGYLVLWSNFENALTTKKGQQEEAYRRADFLSRRDGYEELQRSLQKHLCECEKHLTVAESTLQWYELRRSNNQRSTSGMNSPVHGWSRHASPVPTTVEVRQGTLFSDAVSSPNHIQSDLLFSDSAVVTAASAPSLFGAPTATTETWAPSVLSHSGDHSAFVVRPTVATLTGALQQQATVSQVSRHVQINPIPTAIYGTPQMSSHISPPTQGTSQPPEVVEILKLLTQHQATQQQQLQQQLESQLAMQRQLQQHQASQLALQQQLQQQQYMQLTLLQQQQNSQKATTEMFESLIKEHRQPASSSTHTITAHGPAAHTHTNATLPSPGGSTPTDNPSTTQTAPTAQSSHGGDHMGGRNADGGLHHGFGGTAYPEDGGDGWDNNYTRTAHPYSSSWVPPVRGGFSTGRGRGGTPNPPPRPPPSQQSSQFKLPEPEPFKGDIHDWPRFWEEWTHYVTHTTPDDISKCRLLKKLLQGPAKEITQCYRDTAADYNNLADALNERYDQPDILLSYLQRKLRDMRIPDRENAASLRSFYTQIQALCRQLTDAGRNTDDSMITDTIYSKLPAKMKAEVAKQRLTNPAEGWSTQRLLQLIKANVLLAEHISLSNETQYPAVEKKDVPHHRHVQTIQTCGNSPEEDDTPGSDMFDDANSYVTRSTSLSHSSQNSSSYVAPASDVVLHLHGEEAKRYMQNKVAPPPNKRSGPPHMRKCNDSDDQRKPSGPLPCLFCASSKHRSTHCDKYTTLVACRNRITGPDPALRRCTRCLKPRHEAQTCRRKESCRRCTKRGKKPAECAHHHLMCPLQYPNGSEDKDRKDVHLLAREDTVEDYGCAPSYASEQRGDSDVDSVDYSYVDSEPEELHTYVTHKEDTENVFSVTVGVTQKTLMMTAKVDISNASDASSTQLCTIFFDSGSNSTLITKALAVQLKLPILQRSTTTFRSFADGGKGRNMDTWRVQFNVHLSDGTHKTIEAEAVDEVCGPLPTMSFARGQVAKVLAVSHEAFCVTMDQPQILIGLDNIEEFDLVRRRKRLPNGFSVYDSCVGPIICGRGKVRTHNQGAAKQVHFSDLTHQAKTTDSNATTYSNDGYLADLRTHLTRLSVLRLNSFGPHESA